MKYTQQSTVLYDALGPRGRRRMWLVTIGLTALFLAGVGFVLYRFNEYGRLESPEWNFVTSSSVQEFLWRGMLFNLRAAAIAAAITLVFGLVLALGRMSTNPWLHRISVTWIEFFRGFPLVLLILFPFLLIPRYWTDINPLWYLVVGLALYNSAVVAEIYRAGVVSIEKGQSEAAQSIGLSGWQTMRIVLLPQAIRRMTPLILTQMIILFKDSTLGYVVSYEDVLRRAQSTAAFEPRVVFQVYIVVAVMFFLVNFTLSRGVALLEWRMNRTLRFKGAPVKDVEVEDIKLGGGT